MNYINTETLVYPFSFEQIMAVNQNTSFPPGDDFVAPHPFAAVTPSPKPEFIYATQQVVDSTPILVDGAWVQQWDAIEIFSTKEERLASIAAAQAADDANVRQAAKKVRDTAVDAITVTTASGKVFDGDETSQNRMARGILGLQSAGAESVLWVLADNTATTVTVAELGEALALAGAAQAAVWILS